MPLPPSLVLAPGNRPSVNAADLIAVLWCQRRSLRRHVLRHLTPCVLLLLQLQVLLLQLRIELLHLQDRHLLIELIHLQLLIGHCISVSGCLTVRVQAHDSTWRKDPVSLACRIACHVISSVHEVRRRRACAAGDCKRQKERCHFFHGLFLEPVLRRGSALSPKVARDFYNRSRVMQAMLQAANCRRPSLGHQDFPHERR